MLMCTPGLTAREHNTGDGSPAAGPTLGLTAYEHTTAEISAAATSVPSGERDQIVRTGMTVLGGWAAVNIGAGLTGMALSEDATHRGFWEMNAMWNTVNLGLAGWTLYDQWRSASSDTAAVTDVAGSRAYREESHSLEKVLLFNAGLNFAYMAVGGWMWDRGSRGTGVDAAGISADRLTGWGRSLVLQGAFLLAFDLTMWRVIASDRAGE